MSQMFIQRFIFQIVMFDSIVKSTMPNVTKNQTDKNLITACAARFDAPDSPMRFFRYE